MIRNVQRLSDLERDALVTLLARVIRGTASLRQDQVSNDRALWRTVLEKIEGVDVIVRVERPG